MKALSGEEKARSPRALHGWFSLFAGVDPEVVRALTGGDFAFIEGWPAPAESGAFDAARRQKLVTPLGESLV